MSSRMLWQDWLTQTMFRIRISSSARLKLMALPPEVQQRVRGMLQDLAELADLMPVSTDRAWNVSAMRPLLHLATGRVSVRYTISEENRTLSVEHVVAPELDRDLEPTG